LSGPAGPPVHSPLGRGGIARPQPTCSTPRVTPEFFGQSWPRTFIKTLLLAGGYGLILAFGFIVTGLILVPML
jgi:hypothetical protein